MQSEHVSEWKIFEMLDNLRSTATGLDGLPAWFLRLGAPVFSRQIAMLLNLSIASSTVPQQWKQASIRQSQKLQHPSSTPTFAQYQLHQYSPGPWSEQSFSHIPLSCFPLATILVVFLRPVCIPANRFTSSSYRLPPPHCN